MGSLHRADLSAEQREKLRLWEETLAPALRDGNPMTSAFLTTAEVTERAARIFYVALAGAEQMMSERTKLAAPTITAPP